MSEINLRGLGTGQTLILINGRRVAATSSSLLDGYHQPDLNGIPLSAVERIEVLPTTASGIYGGSATGGVLNVITRRDYNGIEADLTYDNTFDGVASTRRIDLASGFSLEDGRTSILLAASYVEGDPLLLGERSLLRQSAVNSILANNPGFYFNASSPPTGATTNIRSVDGSPLTLRDGTPLNSAITFVPVGYNGVMSDGGAALVANAGNYNFDAPEGAGRLGTNRSILNDPTVKSIRGSAWRQFSANIEAFLEASASENNQAIPSSDASTTFVVPATASTNPFGQNVRVAVASDIADGYLRTESETRQVAGGLILRLPRDWAANLDYGWGHSMSQFSSPAPFSPALASAVAAGSVDLFRNPADVDLARFVQDQELGVHTTPFKSTQNVVSLRMNGPVFSLPAGAAMLTGLVERRRDKFDEGFFLRPPSVIFRYPSRSQTVESVYLEHWLPIVSSKNPLPGVYSMDLQLSGRWDRYTIDGSTGLVAGGGPITRVTNRLESANPTVALRYSPVSDLIIRASWGTGFTPPAANQLAPNAPIQAIGGLVDPRRGNDSVAQAQFVSGGSPDLRSEESESFSAGIVFKPSFVPGLRLSVDYTKIDKNDGIATLSSQGVIDNEAYLPGRIVRSAVLPGDPYGVGPISEIRGGPVNLSKAKVEALDFAFDYRLDLSQRGALEFFLIATRNLHYRTQVSPDALEIENVGVEYLNPLKLKGNAGLTWQQDPWSVGWVVRYFDSYLVSRNPTLAANQGGEGRVPSQIYHDLFATWRFPGSPVTEVQLGINNVFDKEPPYDAAYQNVGNVFGDPRLRSYEISLKVQF